jgi:hypothetical protein
MVHRAAARRDSVEQERLWNAKLTVLLAQPRERLVVCPNIILNSNGSHDTGEGEGTVRELACRMYVIVLDKSVSSTVMTLHTKKMAALPSAKMGMSSYNSKKCSAASCWFTKNSRNLIRSQVQGKERGWVGCC